MIRKIVMHSRCKELHIIMSSGFVEHIIKMSMYANLVTYESVMFEIQTSDRIWEQILFSSSVCLMQPISRHWNLCPYLSWSIYVMIMANTQLVLIYHSMPWMFSRIKRDMELWHDIDAIVAQITHFSAHIPVHLSGRVEGLEKWLYLGKQNRFKWN